MTLWTIVLAPILDGMPEVCAWFVKGSWRSCRHTVCRDSKKAARSFLEIIRIYRLVLGIKLSAERIPPAGNLVLQLYLLSAVEKKQRPGPEGPANLHSFRGLKPAPSGIRDLQL